MSGPAIDPDSTDGADEPGYELVMPFITVQSKGGLHHDDSYVAGWECGTLDRDLAICALTGASLTRTLRLDNSPQIDLIAMKHGFATEVDTEAGDSGWLTYTFRAADSESAG